MFVESALCHGGVLSFTRFLFHLPSIFKFPLPEVWRLVTPFLLTGGGFSFVFDLYFSKLLPSNRARRRNPADSLPVWTYSNGLELNSPRFSQPGDFFTYVVFLALFILVSNHCLCAYIIFCSAASLSASLHIFATPRISARPVSSS